MVTSKRLKFFLSHLVISLLIALCVVGLVFFVWYPSPLAQMVGVTHIFLMVLIVDVIIGPIFGLLVYKEGKKTLKMDLTIIIIIQLSAFFYGVYTIEQGRPVWVAYNVDRFELVRKNEIMNDNIQKALPQFQQPSWLYPQFVGVELAKDSKTRNDDLFAEAFGISLAQKPERYVEFEKVIPKIQQRTQDLIHLEQYNEKQEVKRILAQYSQAKGFVPLKATTVDMTVLVDTDGTVVKIVDLRPW